jgi:hypothetical protein
MAVVLRTVLEEAELKVTDASPEPVARRRFTFSPGRQGRATVVRVSPEVAAPRGSRRFRPVPAESPEPELAEAELSD